MPKVHSFTIAHNGRASVIQSKVHVAEAFDPNNHPHPPFKEYIAIWDTGATGTVITEKVATECGLLPISMCRVETAGGTRDSSVYLVNIRLPNGVGIPNLRVTEATLNGAADILIGMDIIGVGDFAITNKDGKTVCSYRIPSIECIDFVKRTTAVPPPAISDKIGRNNPCTCGSGLKYKKCCGK
ncbi:MAG TPA: retroviral-like aspartic protease family protein [Desulfuromonadaceae bacterium]|jgi:predicted aspartyl protease